SKAFPCRVRSRRGVQTRRSMSALASRARVTRNPSSRGASSRTIVSTSGSSGTLLPDLPPGDVAAVRLPRKCDQLARIAAAFRGLVHGIAQPGDREQPPSLDAPGAVRVASGPGMELVRCGIELA